MQSCRAGRCACVPAFMHDDAHVYLRAALMLLLEGRDTRLHQFLQIWSALHPRSTSKSACKYAPQEHVDAFLLSTMHLFLPDCACRMRQGSESACRMRQRNKQSTCKCAQSCHVICKDMRHKLGRGGGPMHLQLIHELLNADLAAGRNRRFDVRPCLKHCTSILQSQ